MSNVIDTTIAAESLGMTPEALRIWLCRYPEYRPKVRAGFTFLWTTAEIEAVRERRVKLKSRRGRPSGRKTGQK